MKVINGGNVKKSVVRNSNVNPCPLHAIKIYSVLQSALLCLEEKKVLKSHKVKERSNYNEIIQISSTENEIRMYRHEEKKSVVSRGLGNFTVHNLLGLGKKGLIWS